MNILSSPAYDHTQDQVTSSVLGQLFMTITVVELIHKHFVKSNTKKSIYIVCR